MLNKEKYAEEILEVACEGKGFALVGNKIRTCNETSCGSCSFYSTRCDLKKEEWANSEYVEPPVDWTKVPVDTPILVRDYEKHEWTRRYFARYVNGKVLAWRGGATSWSTDYKDVIQWKYAKLAESEE